MVARKPQWPFFFQFSTLCYHEYLHRAITELKKGLAVKNGNPEHDSQKNLKEEKALLDWLDDMSIERLFAWFDCIEEIKVMGVIFLSTILI